MARHEKSDPSIGTITRLNIAASSPAVKSARSA